MTRMDVSVIIVNWNTRDILKDCLESVFSQTKGVTFEAIVVDNGSTDGSCEMVRRDFPQVVLIDNAENRGFAQANNQGILAARGRYYLLLNSDTLVLNDAISGTVSYADGHPDVAVVGCRLLNRDRSLQMSCFMYPSITNMVLAATHLCHLFPRNRVCGRERLTWWDWKDERDVEVVAGAFMLVRRDAVEQVGLMDTSFFMYAEETDWCYRFKQAGWRIVYTPASEIIHLGGASSSKVANKMLLQLRGSLLLFFRKHRGTVAYGAACLLLALHFALRTPYWLVRAAISPDKGGDYWRMAMLHVRGTALSMLGGLRFCRACDPRSRSGKA